jgi:hypothetical protein
MVAGLVQRIEVKLKTIKSLVTKKLLAMGQQPLSNDTLENMDQVF